MSAVAKGSSSFWRNAGLSYLQYLSITSKVVRASLKEPLRTKAAVRGTISYNRTVAGGEKDHVSAFVTNAQIVKK